MAMVSQPGQGEEWEGMVQSEWHSCKWSFGCKHAHLPLTQIELHVWALVPAAYRSGAVTRNYAGPFWTGRRLGTPVLWNIIRTHIPQIFLNIFPVLSLNSTCCGMIYTVITDFFSLTASTVDQQRSVISLFLFLLTMNFIMRRRKKTVCRTN